MIKAVKLKVGGRSRKKTIRYRENGRFVSKEKYEKQETNKQLRKEANSLKNIFSKSLGAEQKEPPEQITTKIGKDGKKYYFDEKGRFVQKMYRPDYKETQTPDAQFPYWESAGTVKDSKAKKVTVIMKDINGKTISRKTLNRDEALKELQDLVRDMNSKRNEGIYLYASISALTTEHPTVILTQLDRETHKATFGGFYK